MIIVVIMFLINLNFKFQQKVVLDLPFDIFYSREQKNNNQQFNVIIIVC